ncbi:MAG TPA: hypothetical protein VI934_00995 [Candidatus Nanoarchaeia archaeon]|nr:hypothetical protein [Candidatus Nanoarchaeia archaeon]
MGVEEIQKVNALARELMKHGIVHTSDEALLRAEDMLRPNSVDSMTEAISSHMSVGKPAHAMPSQEAISSLNMDIRSLGVRFDAVAREVLGLKDEIKKLGGNVGDVSQQVTRLSVQGLQAAQHVMPAAQSVAVAAAAVAPQAPVQQSFARESIQAAPQFERPKAPAMRQKEEQYKPEDVAIEKIFYFGK